MKGKKSIFKMTGIFVLAIFLMCSILAGCDARNKGQAASAATETTIADTTASVTSGTVQLSEQPDKAKFDEYLTEFYLGKIPAGTDANPENVPEKTSVFTSEDQFCVVWTQKKDIPAGSFSSAVYDTVAKKDYEPKTAFPMALSAGGHMGSQPLTYPVGKYEYKVYIDDVPVIVMPFEVR